MKIKNKYYEILIISISSPLKIGVYENNILIENRESSLKTSEILLEILMEFMKKYNINKIYYTNGPGSYMSIKLTYIILKTIEIMKNIKFFGYDSFSLNKNIPIKAIGKFYFIKDKDNIIMKKFDSSFIQFFSLPKEINILFSIKDNKPLYIVPSV